MSHCLSGTSQRRTWSDWPARHQHRVEDMRRRGWEPDVRATQAGRQQATQSFYASLYYRRTSTPFLLPPLLSLCASVGLLLWAVFAPFVD